MKTALLYPYKKANSTGCYPPVSLLYLAATLQQAGKEVRVYDIDDGDLSEAEFIKKVAHYTPDLIGLPLFSNSLSSAYRILSFLKTALPECKIVIGGPHATSCHVQSLQLFHQCDYVLRGESEDSIVSLVNILENNGSLADVDGLAYRYNGEIMQSPSTSLIKDLDRIPFPARDLLEKAYKKGTYWRLGHGEASDVIITSRGCPYDCNFCFKVEREVRYRSPENVLEELLFLRNKGVRFIQILDDLFIAPKTRCLALLNMIKDQKLGIEFKVRARTDLIDEELLFSMKQAGVKSVVYGIESGSQIVLDAMNKGTRVSTNYNAIALTKKLGLQCHADMLIGYPCETLETLRETENFILKSKPSFLTLDLMCPYPNTKVYEEAKKDGRLINDWGIEGQIPWVKMDGIANNEDLTMHRNRIVAKYLRNPVVIFNLLRVRLFKSNISQLVKILKEIYALITVSKTR